MPNWETQHSRLVIQGKNESTKDWYDRPMKSGHFVLVPVNDAIIWNTAFGGGSKFQKELGELDPAVLASIVARGIYEQKSNDRKWENENDRGART